MAENELFVSCIDSVPVKSSKLYEGQRNRDHFFWESRLLASRSSVSELLSLNSSKSKGGGDPNGLKGRSSVGTGSAGARATSLPWSSIGAGVRGSGDWRYGLFARRVASIACAYRRFSDRVWPTTAWSLITTPNTEFARVVTGAWAARDCSRRSTGDARFVVRVRSMDTQPHCWVKEHLCTQNLETQTATLETVCAMFWLNVDKRRYARCSDTQCITLDKIGLCTLQWL